MYDHLLLPLPFHKLPLIEAISCSVSSLSANANEFPAMFDVCYAADDLQTNAPTPSSASRSLSETPLISLGS